MLRILMQVVALRFLFNQQNQRFNKGLFRPSLGSHLSILEEQKVLATCKVRAYQNQIANVIEIHGAGNTKPMHFARHVILQRQSK